MVDKWGAYFKAQANLFELLKYKPHKEQESFHRDTHRVRLAIGGERAGKSYMSAMDGLGRSFSTNDGSPGVYWIVGPDYLQARPEFQYLLDSYRELGLEPKRLSQPQNNASPWVMELSTGVTWETRSSNDIRRLASFAVDGIIMAEAAQHGYDVFLKLRGRLAERRAWMIMSGTLEGSMSWYADCYNRWQADNKEGAASFSVPMWSNTTKFPGGRNDPEILLLEASYPADLFMERFGAIPCKPYGLVFKEFDFAKHVGEIAVCDLPVELAIDPGYQGAYAVLAIQDGSIVNVIDEVYARYATAQEVIEECKARWWWPLVPKGKDGKTGGVIDVAGRAHTAQASQVEIWQKEAGVTLRSRPVSIQDGIMVVRTLLVNPANKQPRIRFAAHLSDKKDHDGHPLGLLSEFGMYKYPERGPLQAANDNPIDKYNHSSKALGYWEYDKHGPAMGRKIQYRKRTRSYFH